MSLEPPKSNSLRPLVPFALVAALGLRIALYGRHYPLEFDESMLAVNLREASWGQMFHALPFYDQAAPIGYLLGSKLLAALFGYSDWGMRLFSLVSSVIALIAFARSQAFTALEKVFVLLFFSVSTACIQYGQEGKQYSVELSLSLLLCIASRAWMSGHSRRGERSFLAIATLSAFFVTGFPFLFAGFAIPLLASAPQRKELVRRAVSFAAVMLVWAAYFLAVFVPAFRFNKSEGLNYGDPVPPLTHPAQLLHWAGSKFFFNVLVSNVIGGPAWKAELIAVVLFIGPWLVVRMRGGRSPFFVRVTCTLLAVCFAAAAVHALPISQTRWFMFVMPPFALAAAESYELLSSRTRAFRFAFLVPLIFLPKMLVWLRNPRPEDARKTLAYLHSVWGQQPVLATPSSEPFLDFYFQPFHGACSTTETVNLGYVNRCSAMRTDFHTFTADVEGEAARPGAWGIQTWTIDHFRDSGTAIWREVDGSGVDAAMDRFLVHAAQQQKCPCVVAMTHAHENYTAARETALQPFFGEHVAVKEQPGPPFRGVPLEIQKPTADQP